jgi:ATP-dependent RNA circularization protein (DNA/RNA ligase family)
MERSEGRRGGAARQQRWEMREMLEKHRQKKQRLGARLVRQLTEFLEHVRTRKPVEEQYKVRTVNEDRNVRKRERRES